MRGLVLAAALAVAGIACCQLLEFCRLKDVKVEPLPNGVRIRLIADGVIRLSYDALDYWQQDPRTKEWYRRQRKDFSFLLENVRGIPASLISVARYPVSHIEFGVPPGTRESLGVICTVHLYQLAVLGDIRTRAEDENRGSAEEAEEYPTPIYVDVEPSHDGSQLYIFVKSDRPYEPGWKRTDAISAPPSLHIFRKPDGTFHASAVNVDIHQVLQRLSTLAQVPIYIDDEVQHSVSLEVDGMSVDQIIEAIAAAYALSVARSGGAYYLSTGLPGSAAAYWAATVARIPLRHITAQSALDSLPDVLRRYVRPDPESNVLVAVGSATLVQKVARDVEKLDQPVWYTRAYAWVVESACDYDDWRRVRAQVLGGETQLDVDSDGTLFVDVDRRRPHEILAQLRVLRSRGLIKLRASPSVAVANGQWAELFVGQRQYYWRLVQTYRRQEIGVTYAEAGTRLGFSPVASGEAVRATIVLRSDAFGGSSLPPIALQRRIRTTLMVPSGGTVIAGGIHERQADKQHTESTLHDWLPLMGSAFTGREQQGAFRELWIFLKFEARRGSIPAYEGGT
ncbi:MAG: hypothetical protein H5T86_09455 [Armatimonadetes bacterium]|nr:hypothetical protein [Armatimonadota bacterium]